MSSTTITVSLTAKSGTAPTDGTSNRTLRVGGAWEGPNGTSSFPIGFIQATLTNASADIPRVNFRNEATYSITSAMTHSVAGPTVFQGFTTSYGDLGKAVVDGGTSGVSYILMTLNAANLQLLDFVFQNNGATGTANGLACNGADNFIARCVVNNVRGYGFANGISNGQVMIECEAYLCNQSNNVNTGGFSLGITTGYYSRLLSHDNAGSNSVGFRISASTAQLNNCIADSNGSDGFQSSSNSVLSLIGCDSYNNGGDGLDHNSTTAVFVYL